MKKTLLLLMVLFFGCKKSSPPPKMFDCQYQYDVEKTFKLKDSISFPACPKNFSLKYLGQNSIQVYGQGTGVTVIFAYHGPYDTVLMDICKGLSIGWHGATYQVTHFSNTSVTVRIKYNFQ